jgi:hypothetical protein
MDYMHNYLLVGNCVETGGTVGEVAGGTSGTPGLTGVSVSNVFTSTFSAGNVPDDGISSGFTNGSVVLGASAAGAAGSTFGSGIAGVTGAGTTASGTFGASVFSWSVTICLIHGGTPLGTGDMFYFSFNFLLFCWQLSSI